MDNSQEKIKLSFDEIYEKGMAGQRKILDDMLASGVPLHYTDEQGNYVQENPDGSIDILRKANEENV